MSGVVCGRAKLPCTPQLTCTPLGHVRWFPRRSGSAGPAPSTEREISELSDWRALENQLTSGVTASSLQLPEEKNHHNIQINRRLYVKNMCEIDIVTRDLSSV